MASMIGQQVNYLVSSYTDFRDVVLTLEQWISQTAPAEMKAAVRETMTVSVRPLSDGESFILSIRLHEAMFQ
jgi:hypothetical protein